MIEIIKEFSTVLLPGLGIVLCAFLLPYGILVTRDNVKLRRQETIKELERFFRTDKNNRASIIPSFEFVKTKYYITTPIDIQTNRISENTEIPMRWYSIPVIIFSGLSAICFYISTVLMVDSALDYEGIVGGRINVFKVSDAIPKSVFFVGGAIEKGLDLDKYFVDVISVAMFAFLGSYIASIKMLIRSVANFNLSPL